MTTKFGVYRGRPVFLSIATRSRSGNCYERYLPVSAHADDTEVAWPLVKSCLALNETWGGWEEITRLRLFVRRSRMIHDHDDRVQKVLDRFKRRIRENRKAAAGPSPL